MSRINKTLNYESFQGKPIESREFRGENQITGSFKEFPEKKRINTEIFKQKQLTTGKFHKTSLQLREFSVKKMFKYKNFPGKQLTHGYIKKEKEFSTKNSSKNRRV